MATANRPGFTIDKGLSQTWESTWVVASGAVATIGSGSPTKCVTADASIAGAVVPMVDTDGTVTAMRFTGMAKTISTDTAAAAGTVDTYYPVPGLVYRGGCKVSTTMNTQAKINALMGARVIFDLTGTTWTVDAAATDALVNCVCIVGGIPASNECLFVYAPKGTICDTSTSM